VSKLIRDWAERKPGGASDGTLRREGDLLLVDRSPGDTLGCDMELLKKYEGYVVAAFAPTILDEDVLLLKHDDTIPKACAEVRDKAHATAAYHGLLTLYVKNPAADTDEEHEENLNNLRELVLYGGEEPPTNLHLYCYVFGLGIPEDVPMETDK